MDPDVTLQMMRDALAAEEWKEAAQHARHLDEWISRGGYVPGAWKVGANS